MLAESLLPDEHITFEWVDALPIALVVIDNKGMVVSANPHAKSLLGVPLLQRQWRDIINQVVAPNSISGHEVLLNNQRLVKVDTSPMQLSQKNGKYQSVVLTDLTETRHLQQRIAHLQRLSALGEMVAKLAHQIRTPLSAAMLYADNLKSPLPAAHTTKFAKKCFDRLTELEMQVNDMLLFAKSGQQPAASSLSVNTLFESVEAQCQGVLDKHGVKLTRHGLIPPDLIVRGNATALIGAIANLIDNAAQVQPADVPITIECAVKSGHLTFSITDCGPGIDSAIAAHIFTPFYTTKTHGTGLGLAVVRNVFVAHAGQVELDRSYVNGARFNCRLPTILLDQE